MLTEKADYTFIYLNCGMPGQKKEKDVARNNSSWKDGLYLTVFSPTNQK
jgi:hypothetical protein